MKSADEYVSDARSEGKPTQNKYSNGISYVFITEPDGWISILSSNGYHYSYCIQAADEAHAEFYIAMREPAPVGARNLLD